VVDNETLRAALPGYEIGVELGRGAFGVVVAGRHRQLERDVAIKLLSPGLVRDEVVRARFLAEARVLAAITHPHIVPVFDYVEQDDACILVMERLGGGTVWKRFVDYGLDQRTACAIVMVACSGLSGAHSHGVLHRDMKPENMLFGEEGVVKVTDFGIARVLGDDDALATRGGEILGTPAYMAPEQASGSDLGPQTDVYATGVMLYELLSGQLPYPEDAGNLATVLRHINEDATPLLDVAPLVPTSLSETVMRSIARDPSDRYATAEDFGVAIGHAAGDAWGAGWISGVSVHLREPGPILASVQSPVDATPAAPAGDSVVMKPSINLHSVNPAATGLEISDLMPLRQAPVTVPDAPKRLPWAALAIGVLAFVLGLLGVGSSSPAPSLASGSVTIAGVDPQSQAVAVDLGRPISIVVSSVPNSIGTLETARLVLSLGDVPVVTSTSAPFVAEGGSLTTSVDASSGRYIVGGHLTARLQLTGSSGKVTEAFALDATSSPFSTFIGIVGVLLVLIVAAYAESLLRSLRRGRRRDNRTASIIGLVVVGVFGGGAATLLGWMLEISRPTLMPFVIAGAVGGVAGLLAALAGARFGNRNRALRQSHRLVLVARRSAQSSLAAPAEVG
jgi:hypothetical protein